MLCLLVRHAAHDLVERVLVGRMDDLGLSEDGRQQAAALAIRLRHLQFTRVQASPRRRALETAGLIAATGAPDIETCAALDEMDFGRWVGRTFDDLAADPLWAQWNSDRGHARPPGGESMAEAQERIVEHLQDMHAQDPRGRLVMVTHAEIIRAAVLHSMSLPLEEWARIEVPPASVTRLEMRSPTHSIVSLGAGMAA